MRLLLVHQGYPPEALGGSEIYTESLARRLARDHQVTVLHRSADPARGDYEVTESSRDWVRVVELAPGRLVYSLAPGLSDDPGAELRDALLKATGERWQVERGTGDGAPTLREQAEAAKAAEAERIRSHPLVEAAFAAFPGAEIVDEADGPRGERHWNKRA